MERTLHRARPPLCALSLPSLAGGWDVLPQRKGCVYAQLNELQSLRVQAILLQHAVRESQKRGAFSSPVCRCSANSHPEQQVVATLQQAT